MKLTHKLFGALILTAGVLSATSATVTASVDGKCTLSMSGHSYSAASIDSPADFNKQYSAGVTSIGSFLSNQNPTLTSQYKQEAYQFEENTKQDSDLSKLQVVTLTDEHGDCHKYIIDPTPTAATPEPSTVLMLGGGLLVVAGVMRRRNKNVTQN